MKRYIRFWGQEVVIGKEDKVVRLYWNKGLNRLTIDMSQFKDKSNQVYIKISKKYPESKICILDVNEERLNQICTWFENQSLSVNG